MHFITLTDDYIAEDGQALSDLVAPKLRALFGDGYACAIDDFRRVPKIFAECILINGQRYGISTARDATLEESILTWGISRYGRKFWAEMLLKEIQPTLDAWGGRSGKYLYILKNQSCADELELFPAALKVRIITQETKEYAEPEGYHLILRHECAFLDIGHTACVVAEQIKRYYDSILADTFATLTLAGQK